MVVSYDTAVLNFIGLANKSTLTPSLIGNVNTQGNYAWKITISAVEMTSVNLVSGKLCDLVFIYKSGSSNLTILPSPDLELINSSLNPINTSIVNGGVSSTVITAQPANTTTCEGYSYFCFFKLLLPELLLYGSFLVVLPGQIFLMVPVIVALQLLRCRCFLLLIL